MAKAWIPEMANRVAYQCVQLHGGVRIHGRISYLPVLPADVRVIPIFAGTTEVHESHRRKDDGVIVPKLYQEVNNDRSDLQFKNKLSAHCWLKTQRYVWSHLELYMVLGQHNYGNSY